MQKEQQFSTLMTRFLGQALTVNYRLEKQH